MALLDVHVLLSPATLPAWREQCMTSIEAAQKQAGFEVAVHVLPGVPNHIGFARHQAYRKGNAPYVTNVDDDDFIDANTFALMKEGLFNSADALFPLERILPITFSKNGVIEGTSKPGRQRHSMKTFQRRHLLDHHQWRWAGDIAQLAYLQTRSALVDLPMCYTWRHYPTSNSMPVRMRWPEELSRAWHDQHVPMNP
jgi:hypothetical protein